jgi:hypothetical protein
MKRYLYMSSLLVFGAALASRSGTELSAQTATSAASKMSAPSDSEKHHRAISALQRAQKAFGGTSQLQTIRDITRTVKMVELSSGATAEETIQILFPRSIRLSMVSGLGDTISYCDGEKGWAVSDLGVDESIAEWQVQAARQDVLRQLEFLVQSDRYSDRSVDFVNRGEIAGRAADELQIKPTEGDPVFLWIDVASGDVLKLEYPRVVPRGKGPLVTDFYTDYRSAGRSFRIPYKIHTDSDGKPYMDTVVQQIEYNKGLRMEDLATRDR